MKNSSMFTENSVLILLFVVVVVLVFRGHLAHEVAECKLPPHRAGPRGRRGRRG